MKIAWKTIGKVALQASWKTQWTLTRTTTRLWGSIRHSCVLSWDTEPSFHLEFQLFEIPTSGAFPFEMHDAAKELEDLSYGIHPDAVFHDVSWPGSQFYQIFCCLFACPVAKGTASTWGCCWRFRDWEATWDPIGSCGELMNSECHCSAVESRHQTFSTSFLRSQTGWDWWEKGLVEKMPVVTGQAETIRLCIGQRPDCGRKESICLRQLKLLPKR